MQVLHRASLELVRTVALSAAYSSCGLLREEFCLLLASFSLLWWVGCLGVRRRIMLIAAWSCDIFLLTWVDKREAGRCHPRCSRWSKHSADHLDSGGSQHSPYESSETESFKCYEDEFGLTRPKATVIHWTGPTFSVIGSDNFGQPTLGLELGVAGDGNPLHLQVSKHVRVPMCWPWMVNCLMNVRGLAD